MRARKWLRRIIVLWIVTGLVAGISMFRPPVLCIGTRAIALMDGRIVMVFADRPIFRIPAVAGGDEMIGAGNVRTGLAPGPLWLPTWINSGVSTVTGGKVVPLLSTWYVWLPLPLLLILFGALAIALFVWSRRNPQGHCRKCGYNLTGNTSGACPECGAACPHQNETLQSEVH